MRWGETFVEHNINQRALTDLHYGNVQNSAGQLAEKMMLQEIPSCDSEQTLAENQQQ